MTSDSKPTAEMPPASYPAEGEPRAQRKCAPSQAAPSQALRAAILQARMDAAEQSDSIEDLRDRDRARLAILRDRLQPMFDGLPANCALFDLALARAGRPRLFLDMIAFVDIARDGRTYRLALDARYGRRKLAESAELPTIEAAIIDYVARRLVEREKFLAEEDAAAFAPGAQRTPARFPDVKNAPAPKRRLARQLIGFFAEMVAALLVVAALVLALAKIAVRAGA